MKTFKRQLNQQLNFFRSADFKLESHKGGLIYIGKYFQVGPILKKKCVKSLSINRKHGRRKVHDYFLLLLCKSSIWFTKQHMFRIIVYFLIYQNVSQIMSFHLKYMIISYLKRFWSYEGREVGLWALADLSI